MVEDCGEAFTFGMKTYAEMEPQACIHILKLIVATMGASLSYGSLFMIYKVDTSDTVLCHMLVEREDQLVAQKMFFHPAN